jgi:thioredoxin reductase (NADPH)
MPPGEPLQADDFPQALGEIFPTLSAAQIAAISPLASERSFADGERIWEQGDRDNPMFVVLEGGIEIISGQEQAVTVHTKGAFTGDVDLLSGRPAVVRARAKGKTRVLQLPAAKLRELVQTNSELMELFLKAFILRRLALMSMGAGNVVLIGSRHSPGTLALQEFLTRNNQPYTYLDVDVDADVQQTLDSFGVGVADVPVFICRGERVLRKPSVQEAAECLGLDRFDEDALRDMVVIGGGPAGLAAAVYSASEGLDTLVVEANAPGGQAGSSSRIENYLGFPVGISGQELAGRAIVQAEKFGAEVAVARTAVKLVCQRRPYIVDVGGALVKARTVVIATGVQYRKAEIPNLARFEGLGVYYSATHIEATVCGGEAVIVVGGGNSAGQAAVFLASHGCQVQMLVRGPCLAASMSRYLVHRIEETPNIALQTHAQIESFDGAETLTAVTWRVRNGSEEVTTRAVRHVFFMTGAIPNTDWLQGCLALDDKRFVKTGPDISPAELAAAGWPLQRAPLLFETSLPGVFAVGDVRANSVKRVAAAVGEGSVCVQLVHKVLAE